MSGTIRKVGREGGREIYSIFEVDAVTNGMDDVAKVPRDMAGSSPILLLLLPNVDDGTLRFDDVDNDDTLTAAIDDCCNCTRDNTADADIGGE
jgi:hypothetical protein